MSVKTLNGIEQSLIDVANGNYRVMHVSSRSRKTNPEFVKAICIVKSDPALTFGKTYRVKILASGRILVKDDKGESVICNQTDFQMTV